MNEMKEKKNPIAAFFGVDRSTKAGTYSVAIALIVLAVLVVVNLIVGALPSSLTRMDISENKINTISATSKKFIADIDETVYVYILSEGGTPDELLTTFLSRYTDLSSHIKVKIIDPVADPAFLENYSGVSSLSNNSLIIETTKRFTAVDYESLEYYYIEGMGAVPATTYASLRSSSEFEQYYYYYYQYYGIDLTAVTHYFGGEEAITGALEYVTLETIPHLYILSGDGERTVGSTVEGLLGKANLEYESLNLNDAGTIPADASTLLIQAPRDDLSASAAETIRAWVADGGNLMLITAPENATMPNLMSLVTDYGVSAVAGTLYEGNANRYKGSASNILTAVNYQHTITNTVYQNGYTSLLSPSSHAIAVADTLPDGITVTPLFYTSSTAYIKNADGSEGATGQYYTGVAIENETNEGKIVWLSSADAYADTNTDGGMSPFYYLTMALSWENKTFTSSMGAIESTQISDNVLSASDGQANLWFVILVVAVPVVILTAAVVIWLSRKKR